MLWQVAFDYPSRSAWRSSRLLDPDPKYFEAGRRVGPQARASTPMGIGRFRRD